MYVSGVQVNLLVFDVCLDVFIGWASAASICYWFVNDIGRLACLAGAIALLALENPAASGY